MGAQRHVDGGSGARSGPRRSRSARWRSGLAGLVVVVLATALSVPARAEDGGTTPEEATPLWCTDGSSMGATEGTRYGAAWVPAGAKVTFRVRDIEITPSFYVGNGRGEYIYTVRVKDPATGSTLWSAWNFNNVGIVWHGGPYEPVSVSDRTIGTFVNATGSTGAFLVEVEASRTYAGAGTTYTLEAEVSVPFTSPSCDDGWVRNTLGPQHDNGEAADPVNTASGNFFDTVVDIEGPGALGEDLLGRTYNSRDPGTVVDPATGRPGIFGLGWTSWLDTALWPAGPDELVYREATGRQVDIVRTSSGPWTSPSDLPATVSDIVGGREMTFVDGRSLTFDAEGRILAADDGEGETAEVARDATTHVPEEVVFRRHGVERARLELSDSDDDGLVDLVEGPGGVLRAYTYSGGQLTSVSVPHLSGQPAPAAETYVWGTGRIEEVRTEVGGGDPAVVRAANTYDGRGRVTTQVQADGDTTTFSYGPLDTTGRRTTTVTHTGSSSTETYVYVHDVAGRVLGVEDPDGNDVGVTWSNRRAATATSRSGAVTTYSYDAQGRVVEVALPDPADPGTSDRSEEVTYCTAAPDDLRVRSLTDAAGMVTEYAYGDPGDPGYPCGGTGTMPSSVTAAAGTADEATTEVEWTADLPTKVTDADGVVTRYRWDTGRGLLLATERDPDPGAPGAEVTFYAYDDAGRPVIERSPSGIETWTTYDAAGNVLSLVGPVQAPSRGCTALADTCTFPGSPPGGAPIRSFTYRLDGSVATSTDAAGETWTHDRDPLVGGGRQEVETAPDGTAHTRVFDTAGRMTSESVGNPAVPAEVATTTYAYGPLGRVASVTDPTGVETRFEYDVDGNVTRVVDEDDEAWERTYDVAGRVVASVDPLGRETTYAYGPTGSLEEVVDGNDQPTTYTYDSLGRLIATTDARGGVTARTYTPAGRLESETDATGRTTSYEYDGAGRLVATTYPSGAEATYGYDAEGRLVTETSPEGRLRSTAYDSAGRALTVDDPATGLTTSTYSPRGELLTRTDATGGMVEWTYDEVGRVASVTDPLGEVTTYGYDSRGNRALRVDALAGVREWHYDLADRVVEEVDPLERSTTYVYDGLGRLGVRTDGAGRTEAYGYDAAGQVTSLSYASGTPTTFTYDGEGRRTKIVDGSGTTSFAYNATGLLTGVNAPGDRDVTFAWDPAGRRTVIRYPDAERYRNRYDLDGRLAEVEHETAPNTWVDVAVNAYDDDGLLVGQDQGVEGERIWSYDAVTGLLEDYSEVRGTTTTTTLAYDAAGRIASEATGGVSVAYGYDDAGQLVAVDRNVGDDETYAYDALGRRSTSTVGAVTTTYEWDAGSQLNRRTVGGVAHTYQYDDSGRRTREAWDSGTHVRQWYWGARGQMTGQRATDAGTVTHIGRTTRGDGTLVGLSTTVDGTPTDTTSIVWDPTSPGVAQPVWTGDPGTTNATRAVYGPDLIRVDCAGGTGCTGPVHHDHHGSALQAVATTARTQATAYDAYGDGGPFAIGATYGYRGELATGDTVHLRARDYDPATGTFLEPDPLDGVDGTTTVGNPYHYVDNDPLNAVDPTGLRPDEGGCGGGLLGFVCEHQDEVVIWTASFAAGAICAAAAAPAGPFAAGAAGSVCGGAVYRGLSAYSEGEDPWAAALNPGAIVVDAALGGVLGVAGSYVDDILRPGAGVVDDVVRPGASAGVDDVVRPATPRTPAGSVNRVGGSHNCTSCAIAGDSTLAGRPASAVDLYPGRPIPAGNAAIADYAGRPWRNVSGRSAIERELLEARDGARGIVYDTDGVDAHVWNAVVQNGRVNFIDFQGIGPNGPAAFDAWNRFAFVRTN